MDKEKISSCCAALLFSKGIEYVSTLDSFYLILPDGSNQEIKYCPFCGNLLDIAA